MDVLKKCVFCGSPAGSAEHVFPNWLSKEFGQRSGIVVMDQENGVSRTWGSKIFQHKVKSVCRNCNNGWMADIESSVKEYLGGMALGTKIPIRLDAQMQRNLALWAQKTFLVVQSMYPEADRNVTPRMFKELYERKDIMLLSATFIGFNEVHAEEGGRAAGAHMMQVKSIQCSKMEEEYFRSQIEEGRRLVIGSMKIGHLNFYVVASDLENVRMEFTIENGMQKMQIIAPTPQADVMNWPTTMPSEAFGGWEFIHENLTGEILLIR